MSLLDGLRHRARALVDGERHARELDEEIRFHLALDEMQAAHGGAGDPRITARRRFGNVTYHMEETRRMIGLASLDAVRQDLHYAVRTLRRAPLFSLVAALTLSLGIGATTAVFSVVSGILLRPLPYRDADRLVSVVERRGAEDMRLASYLTFRDWQAQLARTDGAVRGLAFVRGGSVTYRGERGPERLTVGWVTPGFFSLTGGAPRLGRAFAPDEERPGAARVVVLSHALWQQRFGGDPGVIGRALDLQDGPATIVGVMPPGFAYPQWAQLWLPIAAIVDRDPALAQRGVHVDSRVVARLAPDADSARAAAAFAVAQARLAESYPGESTGWTKVQLTSLRTETIGDVRPMLLVLAAAVALVLLLACVNVANLSLVRAAARERELAVRGALGASRTRLARQLLTESALLAVAGGALGVLVASGAVSLVRHAAADTLPRTEELAVDGAVLAFAVGVSVLAALLAGVAPALAASAPARLARLRAGVLGAVGGRHESRLREALAAVQLSLAVTLLVGAGLLVQSFRRLERVPLGLDPAGVVTAAINPPKDRYDTPAQAAALYERIMEAARAVPGVQDVTVANHLPLTGAAAVTPVEIEGHDNVTQPEQAFYRTVSDSYLRTLRIPLIAGRFFTEADMRAPAAAGIVVNETAAKHWWPGQSPIGRRLTVHRSSQARPDFGQPIQATVIGVISDVRGLGRAADVWNEVYLPYTLEVWPWISFAARTSTGAAAVPALRRALLRVDPELPVGGDTFRGGFEPMDRLLERYSAQRRFATGLLGTFALVALGLAALGLYGIIAYGVSQRTREMGVRLALGAPRGSLLRLVMREAVGLAVVGIALGVAGAAALARLLRALLFETTVADPATYTVTLVVLGLATLLASLLPALRAARLDPTVAMRGE